MSAARKARKIVCMPIHKNNLIGLGKTLQKDPSFRLSQSQQGGEDEGQEDAYFY